MTTSAEADSNRNRRAVPGAVPLSRTKLLKAALSYARKGIPVFPLRAGGKEPLTDHGYLDASTDPRKIHAWWSRWPRANIGIPTGERSGLLVVDLDPRKGGDGLLDLMLDRLEAERIIPPTLSVYTGGGGLHLYYRYPAGETIRNSVGKLAPGVDVRGEGGYVVAPPSCTQKPYRWAERWEISEPPAWILEELAEKPKNPTQKTPANLATRTPAELPAGPIPEGRRNDALFRLACSLRGRGHDEGEIRQALEEANEERCSPPVPAGELAKIAASAAKYPAGELRSKPRPSAQVLEALNRIEARLWRSSWKGIGGKTDRDVLVTSLKLARQHGERIPAGVRITVGLRALALAAAISRRSCVTATRRLRDAGWIRRDDSGRRGTEAGAIVLLIPDETPPSGDKNPAKSPRASLHHSTAHTTPGAVESGSRFSGASLRAPFTAPRLRWGAPTWAREGDEWVRGYIRRLGKSCGQVLDALEAAGGSVELSELAELVGCSRPRDLRRRVVAKLEAAGVVECTGALVVLRGDWLEKLEEERERAGEHEAQRRDIKKYAREREVWCAFKQRPADRAPSAEEMKADRKRRGEEWERRKYVLYAVVGQRVATTRGPGKLWQVFSGRVGVVLDSDPEQVSYMDPAELTGEMVAA